MSFAPLVLKPSQEYEICLRVGAEEEGHTHSGEREVVKEGADPRHSAALCSGVHTKYIGGRSCESLSSHRSRIVLPIAHPAAGLAACARRPSRRTGSRCSSLTSTQHLSIKHPLAGSAPLSKMRLPPSVLHLLFNLSRAYGYQTQLCNRAAPRILPVPCPPSTLPQRDRRRAHAR
jgi:hypothetical protein